MKPKNKFKKKNGSISKTVMSTIKILLTVALLAVIIMITYYVATEGWEAVIAWFKSSWACMFALVLLTGAVLALWIISIYRKIKAVREDEE